MASTEITTHQKEILAWKIMGEALRFIDEDLITQVAVNTTASL